MAVPVLAIANRRYSSWSLRAWLHLRLSGIPFETVRLPMDTVEWDRRIGEFSPSGRLPALLDGGARVWDSFGIILHVLRTRPGTLGWPRNPTACAEALSVSAEMHSGFLALRREMPFDCRADIPGRGLSTEALEDVDRVQEVWESCRARFGSGGPFLFGEITVADVMYAPVALRFVTYGTELKPQSSAYVRTIQDLPAIREWVRDAGEEVEVMPEYEPDPRP